jgi:uncharacterized membrane protein (UPF0182 family)
LPAGSSDISGRWRTLKLVILAVIILIALLTVISGLIQKGLWMGQLGFSGIFWTLLSLRWGLFGAAFIVALLYLWINFRLAARNSAAFRAGHLTSKSGIAAQFETQISPTVFKLATAAIAALIFALIFYAHWDTYLRFRYGGSFGLSDPLFGVDVGFYLFCLPFYEFLQGNLTALALITTLVVLAFYAYFGLLQYNRGGQMEDRSAKPRKTIIPSTIAKFTLVPHLRRWIKGCPSPSSNPIPERCLQLI